MREPDQRIADHGIVKPVRLGIGGSEIDRKGLFGTIFRADGHASVRDLSFGVRPRG